MNTLQIALMLLSGRSKPEQLSTSELCILFDDNDVRYRDYDHDEILERAEQVIYAALIGL